ncbi:MAG: hypothetical protein ACREGJ_04355 [Candidatus Saccharimonadales bacterium]
MPGIVTYKVTVPVSSAEVEMEVTNALFERRWVTLTARNTETDEVREFVIRITGLHPSEADAKWKIVGVEYIGENMRTVNIDTYYNYEQDRPSDEPATLTVEED